jgi:hypothetical protein
MTSKRRQRKETRRRWAYTRYGAHEVSIFINSHEEFENKYEGLTTFKGQGRVEIDLASRIFDNVVKFQECLLHEFVHVVEQYNSYADLSSVAVDGCTRLARTMGQGLGQLLGELHQVGL